MTKPSEIFSEALKLEPGKQIVISFTDRKKFLSMRTGLHTAKRALQNKTVRIKSSYEETIILQLEEENSFSLEVSAIQPNEQINYLPRSKKFTKDETLNNQLNSLESTKSMLFEEARNIISIIGIEQATLDKLDSTTELYAIDTEIQKVQKALRDLRLSAGLKAVREIPTAEELKDNELSLIEPDILQKAPYRE